MNARLFKLCMLIAALAAFLCTQAVAQPRSHIVVLSKHAAGARPEAAGPPAANFYGISAYLATEPLNQPGNPWDGPYPGNGTTNVPNDLWPCFGGDGTAQPDCETIDGSSSLAGSIVLGSPSYTWFLSANTATTQPYGCDATSTGDTYHMCTQANNFYEDDSGDTSDDLIFTIEIEQGSDIIYDSGIQDYGPNPYGDILAETGVAPVIVFYEDMVFGIPNGGDPNADGPCFQSYNYPSNVAGPGENYQGLANTFEGLFGISPGKDCVAPKAGLATVTITTELATPSWTGETKLSDCPESTMDGPPNGSSPYCYTVKYTKKYEISQKFNIWLE
jgi:hypothetical protein